MSSIDSYFDKNCSLAEANARDGLTYEGKSERTRLIDGAKMTSIFFVAATIAAIFLAVMIKFQLLNVYGYCALGSFFGLAILGLTASGIGMIIQSLHGLYRGNLSDADRARFFQIPPLKRLPTSAAPIRDL